jgi:hypothetical protein
MLYEMYKVEISDEELTRVVSSLYLKEQSTYRYFKEKLFQTLAKKSIE